MPATATDFTHLMPRYCGRDFSEAEMEQIRAMIAEEPRRNRAALSREVCQQFNWRKANGELKDMSARVAMLRMQDDGLIQLPPPRSIQRNKITIIHTQATERGMTRCEPVHLLPSLEIRLVSKATSKLWNEYMHRYHYLGYKNLPGAQLRYFVMVGEQLVALLSFSASAWQCAPRDNHIGWTHEQRKRNLHLIINNSRFLILPWIQCKNLASKTLAKTSRRIGDDWLHRYHYRPVLLETFVEKERFAGTCYQAANWQLLGQTKGRGKLGKSGVISTPIKDIWVYPLQRNYDTILKNE